MNKIMSELMTFAPRQARALVLRDCADVGALAVRCTGL